MSATAISVRHPLGFSSARLRRVWYRLGPTGTLCVVILIILALAAILAPLVAPYSPTSEDLLHTYAGSSSAHLLGTDSLGRDILSRLIWGARTSLLAPLAVIGISLVLGVPLALASVWFGGIVDTVIGRFVDVLFAFPGILLAILIISLYGVGIEPAVIALGIIYTPWATRITRSAALRERAMPYVTACEVQGLSAFAICTRHILPNLRSIIIAQSTIAFGYALVDLAALSFLGLGMQPPGADWGVMVGTTSDIVLGHPQQAFYAGALILICVAALSLLGNRLVSDADEDRA